jgi:hypothetical protein
MADVSKLLESPYTDLVVAIVLGALALSGKFTVTATHALLAFAWAIVIVGLRGQPLPLMVWYGAVAAGVLVLLGYWFSPDPIPRYVGVLYPKVHSVLKNGQIATRVLEIGNSGTNFVLGGQNNVLLDFFGDSQLSLEEISGRLYVSTRIRDEDGKLIAELYRNEWKVAPPPNTWDRNYDRNTLEVKNAGSRIALQVRLLADRVQMQGEWFAPNAAKISKKNVYGIRIVTSDIPGKAGGFFLLFGPGRPPWPPPFAPNQPPFIKPLFKYPSELHFGELINP